LKKRKKKKGRKEKEASRGHTSQQMEYVEGFTAGLKKVTKAA
jgi:hypothetical protein